MSEELNFLNPAIYEDMAHFSILPKVKKGETMNYEFDVKMIMKNSIIFCKTDYIDEIFKFLKASFYKHILITHHSDYNIDFNCFYRKPHNVKKWFGVNITYKHPDLIPIPLGLPTHRGEWFIEGNDPIWQFNNAERFKNKEKILDTVYCNWTNTNIVRNRIISKLQKNRIKYALESNLTLKEYCENMSQYKFIIAPPGNGNADTFRVWESLYFGCIPIVLKHYIYDTWPELPIIQVKDYSNVTYDLLYSYLNKEYNMEKIYKQYWEKRLLNEFNKL